jgi:hypothetical protein
MLAALGTAAAMAALGTASVASAGEHDSADGTVDAGAIATMQPLTIAVSLPAEAHETPRSWLFMIETLNGEAVEAISVETSAQMPTSSADTSPLASGLYRVRILFGSQIATTCGDSIFYQTVLPSSGARTVSIGASPVLTMFTFAECPNAPSGLGVSVDAGDDAARDSGGSSTRVGTFEDPLPPDVGSGLRPAGNGTSGSLTLVSLLMLALAIAGFAVKPLVTSGGHKPGP